MSTDFNVEIPFSMHPPCRPVWCPQGAEEVNYFTAQRMLDALANLFGDYARRVNYDFMVLHLPTQNPNTISKLEELIWNGSNGFLVPNEPITDDTDEC